MSSLLTSVRYHDNYTTRRTMRARVACGDMMYSQPVVSVSAARVYCILMYYY